MIIARWIEHENELRFINMLKQEYPSCLRRYCLLSLSPSSEDGESFPN